MKQQSTELKHFDLAEKTAKIKILTGQVAQNIIEIGKTLLEVQENLPRGEFSNWLENEINYSKSTAYNFIKVAKEFKNVQPVANLGIRKLLALTGIEQEEREKIINDYNLEEMTVKQVEEAIEKETKIKKVNDFVERLSHKLLPHEININSNIYQGLTVDVATRLEESVKHCREVADNIRATYYTLLTNLKENFKNDILFAEFVISNEIIEEVEDVIGLMLDTVDPKCNSNNKGDEQ